MTADFLNPTSSPIVAVVGPTATGKTTRAVHLARAIDAEIISCDSRQIYSGMDIGTGKDLAEYGNVPYHLIDIAPAGYRYNLYEFVRDFNRAEHSVRSAGHNVIAAGGTGLYIETILRGTDLPQVPENPELRAHLEHKSLEELTGILSELKTLHNTTDVDNPKRAIRAIEIETFYREHPEALERAKQPASRRNAVIIGVDIDRDNRRRRISERLDARLREGMVAEVEQLIHNGVAPENLLYYGLEYRYVTLYVTGKLAYPEMTAQLETAIHQFAKRQATWFRGMERRGYRIHWLPYDMPADEFTNLSIEIIRETNRTSH